MCRDRHTLCDIQDTDLAAAGTARAERRKVGVVQRSGRAVRAGGARRRGRRRAARPGRARAGAGRRRGALLRLRGARPRAPAPVTARTRLGRERLRLREQRLRLRADMAEEQRAEAGRREARRRGACAMSVMVEGHARRGWQGSGGVVGDAPARQRVQVVTEPSFKHRMQVITCVTMHLCMPRHLPPQAPPAVAEACEREGSSLYIA